MTKPSDIVAVESDCRMAYEIKCIVFADTLIKYSINAVSLRGAYFTNGFSVG